jgi:hypothetical protein
MKQLKGNSMKLISYLYEVPLVVFLLALGVLVLILRKHFPHMFTPPITYHEIGGFRFTVSTDRGRR